MKEKLLLYNTLTKKKEVFKPLRKQIGMYSCGPTVYWYQHLGNFRTMLLNDFLKRTLIHAGYTVKHVMNITDVDDKTIKASQKEGIPLSQLTRKYEDLFLADLSSLNIAHPTILVRATDSISDMIALIQSLLKKKYAYKASDGIYFSIAKAKNYGQLAGLKKSKINKARIRADEYNKSQPQDFALWKFHIPADGPVFWETNLGKGRPGWHIECSAMAIKNLGKRFDIHTGGQDLIFPHHTNEIAQSEAATGEKFVNYWVHGAFLTMKEEKMSKSKGNILTLYELKKEGYEPVHYRYLCLMTHYRKPLHFSFENLDAAKRAYEKLKRKIIKLKERQLKGSDKQAEYEPAFHSAMYDDLNAPKALQILLKALEDDTFDTRKKLILMEHFDALLGLGIKDMCESSITIPKEVRELIEAREQARGDKRWPEADILRERIREHGFTVQDTPNGARVERV
ncbi:cysteine--tRNA ligase [Candidatus Pacearchaeota archaeon]|nr:cysteine--tRNA ligase [Candidatus Pacearchaeota archaeon]